MLNGVFSSSRNISKISSHWLNKARRQEQTAKDFYWNYFPTKVARGHIHCGSWGKILISWPLMTALQFISTCESILSTSRLNLLRCLLTKLCRDCKSINQSAVSNYHNIILFFECLTISHRIGHLHNRFVLLLLIPDFISFFLSSL